MVLKSTTKNSNYFGNFLFQSTQNAQQLRVDHFLLILDGAAVWDLSAGSAIKGLAFTLTLQISIKRLIEMTFFIFNPISFSRKLKSPINPKDTLDLGGTLLKIRTLS
ncbi:hypothetical protein [Cytobacillus firmus]|uniref:hypothetical protein n=1 Tax=Cytobacillus firmus TaxID=1399 RepID=UPI0024951635|nr:hypothetical protein [Cytobacillus firmus]